MSGARRGLEAFENFYAGVYGERWPAISEALRGERAHVARPNGFLARATAEDRELRDVYPMDGASIAVARALGAIPGETVLDMCAAPGGKSLVVAEDLFLNGEGVVPGRLITNEISQERRTRLTRVLHEYVPRALRENIFVKGLDGNQYGLREPGVYDRVLLDAPCSGEKHLLENPKEMAEWSPRRSENLAVRQYSLLASAWSAVREGGRVVYSTCSLSPLENDEVIAKLLKRRKAEVRVLRREEFLGPVNAEATVHGYCFLPDQGGWGPMYFAVLEKTGVSE